MSQSILVIDDSVSLAKLIKAHLVADHLKIDSAYDGESGLAAAANSRPSLILLDVDMPGLKGFEVCRRLKANPVTASIPIIFLTAAPMSADKVRGLDLGAIDYIVKPFKALEFRARIRAALREQHQSDSATMVDGLTGLWNREYLNLHLNSQVSLAKRSGTSLACVIVNVDHHRAITAKYGAAGADEIVRAIAQILLSQCRAEDVVCRYDVWKFVLLVTGAYRAGAAYLADRLRGSIERRWNSDDHNEMSVTCSFGVCDTQIARSGDLLSRADAAVEKSRHRAGNCVLIAQEEGDERHEAA